MKKLNDYLSVKEAADIIGVHVDTLKLWEKKGILVPRRNPMNNYRIYSREELNLFLKRVDKRS